MDELRTLLAFAFFLAGCYFAYLLLTLGFDFSIMAACLVSFLIAHFIIPKDRKKREAAWDLLDMLELLSDLPYQCCAAIFRFLGRIFGGKDGIDIDL